MLFVRETPFSPPPKKNWKQSKYPALGNGLKKLQLVNIEILCICKTKQEDKERRKDKEKNKRDSLGTDTEKNPRYIANIKSKCKTVCVTVQTWK